MVVSCVLLICHSRSLWHGVGGGSEGGKCVISGGSGVFGVCLYVVHGWEG